MNKKQNYKWFVLIVLTIVYVFNFADRQILIILQEGIKRRFTIKRYPTGIVNWFGVCPTLHYSWYPHS